MKIGKQYNNQSISYKNTKISVMLPQNNSNDYQIISFWCVDITNDNEKKEQSTILIKRALLNFIHLFEKISDKFNFIPFELSQIFDRINNYHTPIYILGSTSKAKAIQHSWQELGLNLFDLPYNSPSKQKIFYYISLSNLLESWQELQQCFIEKSTDNCKETKLSREQALEQLQWGKCHQFVKNIQQAVGHGVRDRFQTESWAKISERLQDKIDHNNHKLPCGDRLVPFHDRCGLHQRINNLIKTSDQGNEQIRLKLAQQVASLDCYTYRLAPAKYFFSPPPSHIPQYKRIVILENNQDFRNKLKEALKPFILESENPEKAIIIANCDQSSDACRLIDDHNKDIIKQLIENENIRQQEILTCFDLDLGNNHKTKSLMKQYIRDIFGGHWVMYGIVSNYPNIPRMIISGFRSQDLLGYSAGGGAYLLKPFTTESLTTQIKKASVLHRVKWLCPKSIQQDYNQLFKEENTFTKIRELLTYVLAKKRIELEVIEEITDLAIAQSNLIILDTFTNNSQDEFNTLEIICKVHRVNPKIRLILIIPNDESVETVVSQYYYNFPLKIKEGFDTIYKKPSWIIADENHYKPEQVLENLIIQQLKHYADYDVKYQVLVPVFAIIGRCDGDFICRVKKQKNESADKLSAKKLYAPLIPLLVDVYGMSARLKDIAENNEQMGKNLKEKIDEEKIDKNRWRKITDNDINEVINLFQEVIKNDESIQSHLSLEAWLKYAIEHQVNDKLDVNSITEPLTRVFGGMTRYEFTVCGSWYKGVDQKIDDLLMTIEFCAKSSIIAKKFIEATVVQYLRKIAKEDCVLVQEIPIRGYLL